MKTLNLNADIDLKQCILWQYANSPALRSLLESKEGWYKACHADFWRWWQDNVFNLETANDFGLTVWGEILKFPRQIKNKYGNIVTLTTEQYRTVLKGQMIKFNMGGTAPEVNKWLAMVFNKEKVYCLDNLNMTAVPFVLEFTPTDEMLWLLGNVDFLPRPAGVGWEVRILEGSVFGFAGSGLETFNNGTFYKDYNQVIDSQKENYQLAINAPQGAKVFINGITGNYQSMAENTSYTYKVEQDGFISLTGQGVLTEDTVINVSSFVIQPMPSNAMVSLNANPNTPGAYFLQNTEFTYSYEIAAVGYVTQKGTGTVTTDTILPVTLSAAQFQRNITGIATGATPMGDIESISAPYEGNYTITLRAEGGKAQYNQSNGFLTARYNDSGGNSYGTGVANGGISEIKTYLSAGDNIRLVCIHGDSYIASHGGAGIGLYINEVLIAVSGGGGGLFSGGGGGYKGGYSYTNYSPNNTRNGCSADYQIASDEQANKEYNLGACGGFRNARIGSFDYQIYGGSGYANPNFNITQTPGGSTTTGNPQQGNQGEGSISIVYTGLN